MIKIELEVTPEQMLDIAAVMAGTYERPTVAVEVTAEQVAAATPELQEQPTDPKPAPGVTQPTDSVASSAEESTDAPAPEQPATSGVDTDTDGLPWDVRIHAGSKGKNADGRWKLRRKPKDMAEPAWLQMIEEVKAELEAAMSATPGDDVPPPPAATEEPADPGAALAAAGNDTPPPPPANAEGDDVPPPPAESASPKTFPELLPLVSAGKANGTITDDQIAVAVTQVGLTKFGELAVRPDLIPQFAELVGV